MPRVLYQASPFLRSRFRSGFGYAPGDSAEFRIAKTLPPELAGVTASQLAALRPLATPDQGVAVTDNGKFGLFNNVVLNIGLVDQNVLFQPQGLSDRIFLQIQNTHATQSLFVRFGAIADAVIGLRLVAGAVVWWDTVVPQDDIHIIGNGAATTGVLIYSNKVR